VQTGEAAFVHLLPALPSAFPNGQVSGLRARGDLEVAIEWRNGRLVRASLAAKESKPLKVRYAGQETEIQARAGRTYVLGADLKPAPR
jgi:alpha-L-fucosidase 2